MLYCGRPCALWVSRHRWCHSFVGHTGKPDVSSELGGRQHSYCQQRGVKEGCPLSPPLFCVVHENFHRTLNKEFLHVKFFVYMDDVAFIAPDSETTHLVLHRVNEPGRIQGFRVNSGKT